MKMGQNEAHSKGNGFVLRHNKSGFKLQKIPTKNNKNINNLMKWFLLFF
jgi:hypothetical protein